MGTQKQREVVRLVLETGERILPELNLTLLPQNRRQFSIPESGIVPTGALEGCLQGPSRLHLSTFADIIRVSVVYAGYGLVPGEVPAVDCGRHDHFLIQWLLKMPLRGTRKHRG